VTAATVCKCYYPVCNNQFEERKFAYEFSNIISVFSVDTNLQIFRHITCELRIVSKFELQCVLQVSVRPRQRDVYVVFITDLSTCLWWSFMLTVSGCQGLSELLTLFEFSSVCFWLKLWQFLVRLKYFFEPLYDFCSVARSVLSVRGCIQKLPD
jgi:hypothetical protein